MTLTSSEQRRLVDAKSRERIERLLERYPAIDTAEEAEILRFLKKSPILQVGAVTSNPRLQAKLARFRADHTAEFAVRGRDILLVAGIAAAFLLAAWLLWAGGTAS